MKKFLFCIALLAGIAMHAQAQDILVTNDGESLKVYHIEVGTTSVFYQLTEDKNAEIRKIDKNQVLIIKKADGTKIDPNATITPTIGTESHKTVTSLRAAPKHEPVTANICSPIQGKKEKKFQAKTPDGIILGYQILSEENKTLAVSYKTKNCKEIIIPEYVNVNGTIYTVTEISDFAFSRCNKLTNIVFPSTLKKIGCSAFEGNDALNSIILPDGLETIKSKAFRYCSYNKNFLEIYIPTSVIIIGDDAFRYIGKDTSPRGLFQGYISCLPLFINESNCSDYGIDDAAVKVYYEASRRGQKR